jgi:hypothetical protein
MPTILIFGMYHDLVVLTKDCSNHAPRIKKDPVRKLIYLREKIYQSSCQNHKAKILDIWSVTSSCGPRQRLFNYDPRVKRVPVRRLHSFIHSFYLYLYKILLSKFTRGRALIFGMLYKELFKLFP